MASIDGESFGYISRIANVARAGYIQAAILFCSVVVIGRFAALYRINPFLPQKHTKTLVTFYRYDIWGHLLRACSLALCIADTVRYHGDELFTAILLAYAFVLGVARSCQHGPWRHVALHHTNVATLGACVCLLLGDVLPMVEKGQHHTVAPLRSWLIICVSGAVLCAFSTPREWEPPKVDDDQFAGADISVQPSPEETSSYLGHFATYAWLDSVLWKGSRRQVTLEDLPSLPWYDEPLYQFRRIQEAQGTVFQIILHLMGSEFFALCFWAAFSYTTELIAPLALYQLLSYLNDPDKATIRPWAWLLLLFVGPTVDSVSFNYYCFRSTRFIVRIKSALVQKLYVTAMSSVSVETGTLEQTPANDKTKSANGQPDKSTSTGRMANLMSADLDAITSGRDIIVVLVGVPVSLVISLTGLYRILSWPALVGISLMVLVSPLSVAVTRRMAQVQRSQRTVQDSRISAISEYLASIRVVKYFAWEEAVAKRIALIREMEQNKTWDLNMLTLLMSQLTEATPILALLLTFSLHVLVREKKLTADIAFTAITLMQTVRRNLQISTNISRRFVAGWVAVGRLDRYFQTTTPLGQHPEGPLRTCDATFKRHKDATFLLKHVSIDFVEGGLNVVRGESGSGKTTLLLSILGETALESGSVTCPRDVAYASQTPWLQSESIKDNILFHGELDALRYDRVIKGCGLDTDFEGLPENDSTEIGQNGASLSGGQRARVALARALYSRAPVLLLDDVFSALDSKTSALVWEKCFCGDMLKGRTVVLVTQIPWIASQADLTISLENGSVKDLEQNIGVIRRVVATQDVLNDNPTDPGSALGEGSTPLDTSADDQATTEMPGVNPTKSSFAGKENEVAHEAAMKGRTSRLQFLRYMRHYGSSLNVFAALLASLLSTGFAVGTGLWLSIWINASKRDEALNMAFYLCIYGAWNFGEIVFNAMTYVLYLRGGWVAARDLHAKFVTAVLEAPLSWYKETPVGRVINRFSRDIDSIDLGLSPLLRSSFESAMRLLFQLGAVGSVLPIFMVPAAVSCFAGIVAGEMYTRTSVAVKRLVSSSQSPLYAQFADSLAGIGVIRARATMSEVFGRSLADKLRVYSRAAEAQFNCNRWVALKIDMVATLVTVAAAAVAVSKAGAIAAGLVGFSLMNATSLSTVILYLVRNMNELEVELQSFERVTEFASVEPEEDTKAYDNGEPHSDRRASPGGPDWPSTGEVEFRAVTVRYDLDGPDILKDVNLKFAPGKRVAIVGRTGSGKSTLALSLLRFTNIVSGQILFDGVDITTFPRKRLRESLTIIPQEAVLFTGDVDSNLDPTDQIPKERLSSALQYCDGIASFKYERTQTQNISEADHSLHISQGTTADLQAIDLSTSVKAQGENFSHGQRQVLSLARALVRKTKLIILDEATASMDYETDRGIQAVLRKELSDHGTDRTLVTIAHRLKTIIDYDRVVVMDAGRVAETGSPRELFAAQGMFYDMMRHSGELEELHTLLDAGTK